MLAANKYKRSFALMHPNCSRSKSVFLNERKTNERPDTLSQFFISKTANKNVMRISFTTGEEGMERTKNHYFTRKDLPF